jgi:RNA polymerase sigma factor (sigma-70 family)
MRVSPLAAHRAKLMLVQSRDSAAESDPRPEMLCFRGQTLALIRHYFEISSQVGRVSSLLGREFFRSRVSHHAIPSFEEQAIFVRDVELCLEKLGVDQREVLTLLGLYDYSYDEVSQMMHCSRTLVRQWFNQGLDCLSEIFLKAKLLRENRPDRRQQQVTRHRIPVDLVGSRRKPPQSVRLAAAAESPGKAGVDSAGKRASRLA